MLRLPAAFGTFDAVETDRSESTAPSGLRTGRLRSAVANGSKSCGWQAARTALWAVRKRRDRGGLPRPGPPSLPRGSRRHGLRPAFAGLVVLRGPLTSAGSSAFVFWVLRPTAYAEPNRSRWVRTLDFVTIPSPVRPWHRRIPGFLAVGRLTRHGRLTALHSIRNGHAPTASTGHPLAGRLAALPRCRADSGVSEQRPCLLGVGFPPSGSRGRIRTRPGRTSAGHVLTSRVTMPVTTTVGRGRAPAPRWGAGPTGFLQ